MISETEKSIPGKWMLLDFKEFENNDSYDRSSLEFDLVEPGDLVKVYYLGIDPIPASMCKRAEMHKLVQRFESHIGIALHSDLTNYFVTVLVDCKKLHFYYRSVKKL